MKFFENNYIPDGDRLHGYQISEVSEEQTARKAIFNNDRLEGEEEYVSLQDIVASLKEDEIPGVIAGGEY